MALPRLFALARGRVAPASRDRLQPPVAAAPDPTSASLATQQEHLTALANGSATA